MLISIEWLNEFISIPFSDEDLCDKLTIFGLESSLDKESRILDIELTPNRPDCMSYLGVAREVSILTNKKLVTPKILNNIEKNEIKNFDISIESTSDCPRYTAVIIRDIDVSNSPEWLKNKLETNGLPSINSIVDISNLVLLELGHPIHIFDLDKLKSANITIRRAIDNEKILTLDGKYRVLNNDNLLICDLDTPIAVAGVMGGKDSEVTKYTNNILIECAYFNPISIRKSSKTLGLSTDASKRFERGVDYDNHDFVINRTISLINEMSYNRNLNVDLKDFYPKKINPQKITFDRKIVSNQIGVDFNDDFIVNALNHLNIKFSQESSEYKCIIPSFRPDLERSIDITEELARIYGFDKIPNKTSYNNNLNTIFKDDEDYINKLKNYFSSVGFNEVMSNSLTNSKKELLFSDKEFVKITNPLSAEMSSLRTNLITGLLNSISYNLRHGEKNLSLYEYGSVFEINNKKRIEKFEFSGIVTGNYLEKGWRSSKVENDFYILKGVISKFLNIYNIDYYVEETNKYEFLTNEVTFLKNNTEYFTIGMIKNDLLKRLKIDQKIHIFKINLSTISKINFYSKYINVPIYPSIIRDLSLTVSKSVEIKNILLNIEKFATDLLEDIKLYDIYEGDQIHKNSKSVTFQLIFRSNDRTLVDSDVDNIMEKIILEASSTLNAKLR